VALALLFKLFVNPVFVRLLVDRTTALHSALLPNIIIFDYFLEV